MGIQDDKIEHIIHDIGSFTPNGKSLSRLRPKKQYLECSKWQQFWSSPISPSVLPSNNEKHHYHWVNSEAF